MRLSDIIGQETVVGRLYALASYCRRNGSPVPHMLIVGQEGMGKRTIAQALAGELGAATTLTCGSRIEKRGDLSAILGSGPV